MTRTGDGSDINHGTVEKNNNVYSHQSLSSHCTRNDSSSSTDGKDNAIMGLTCVIMVRVVVVIIVMLWRFVIMTVASKVSMKTLIVMIVLNMN